MITPEQIHELAASGFTPGSWRYSYDETGETYIYAGRIFVGSATGQTQGIKDAALIAAAPDLLAAYLALDDFAEFAAAFIRGAFGPEATHIEGEWLDEFEAKYAALRGSDHDPAEGGEA